MPFGLVAELASFPEIAYVSSNEWYVLRSRFGNHRRRRRSSCSIAAGSGTINGSGRHRDSRLRHRCNHAQFSTNLSRVLASVDFTGENRTDDPYGHGTFVAAAAAGGTGAGAAYKGIAPGASLLNVRVLNSTGEGTVESVIAGLDWVASTLASTTSAIVNLSLGTRAVESYKYDPLCRAVRGLVNSGIVVFVAAGNDGKDQSVEKFMARFIRPVTNLRLLLSARPILFRLTTAPMTESLPTVHVVPRAVIGSMKTASIITTTC